MIGFGAIVKSILETIESAASAIAAELRGRRLKPCPIPVKVEINRRRR